MKREKKKKRTSNKLPTQLQHTPSKKEENAVTFPTTRQKNIFGHQKTLHATRREKYASHML